MVAAQAARSLLARLFGRETLLNKLPIIDTLSGLTLFELATTAFMKPLELERRKLGIDADLVIEAKIVVDIRSCDLTRIDGANNRCGTGLAVATTEHAVKPRNASIGLGEDAPPFAGNTHSLKRRRDDILADGHVDVLARNHAFGFFGSSRCRAATTRLADDLRLNAQAAGMSGRIDLNRNLSLIHI